MCIKFDGGGPEIAELAMTNFGIPLNHIFITTDWLFYFKQSYSSILTITCFGVWTTKFVSRFSIKQSANIVVMLQGDL
ncbi:MAG: hypothetical protein QN720_05730 [Nitrososphaeraceae archaeon]|jgi:hypothetical protein|nr:hypothetical protein [Nitrososphaeraceae archaeon]